MALCAPGSTDRAYSHVAGERLILAEQTLDPQGNIVEPSRRVQPRTVDVQPSPTSSTPRTVDVPEELQAISAP